MSYFFDHHRVVGALGDGVGAGFAFHGHQHEFEFLALDCRVKNHFSPITQGGGIDECAVVPHAAMLEVLCPCCEGGEHH